MQTKGKSSEEAMIAEWLKAEMWSPRFGKDLKKALRKLKLSQALITHPNLKNKQGNFQRKRLLGIYRGYGKNTGLFANFPKEVRWEKISLTREDLTKIKYINYDYWVKLSEGSRLAADAINNINHGVRVFNQSNQPFLKAAQYLIKHGYFPKLILVACHEHSRLIVLEGHLRLTAFLLAPNFIPPKLEAIIGYSQDFDRWDLY